jgi:hypothetical protein
MIQRKKKQIVYSTEGDNYIRPNFNIKSIFIQGSQDQRTKAPSSPLEPIQPFEPGIPKPIPKYNPSDYPNGYKNDTSQRPGGIDPYYRSRDTTQIKKNNI